MGMVTTRIDPEIIFDTEIKLLDINHSTSLGPLPCPVNRFFGKPAGETRKVPPSSLEFFETSPKR